MTQSLYRGPGQQSFHPDLTLACISNKLHLALARGNRGRGNVGTRGRGDVTNTRFSFVEIQFRPKSNFNYRKLCKWVGININLATLDISRLASGSLIKDKSSI